MFSNMPAELLPASGPPEVSVEPHTMGTIGTSQPVTMQPVVFGGCYGWLHAAAEAGDVAVLICPALSRDALDSHHGLRLLADECAASGYPALRFDYPGLGDSCDPAGPVEHWSSWERSVQEAADTLCRVAGTRRILFCGLRIGATLAARAAMTRADAAGLLLLAPVLRGKSYMRQLQVEARIASGADASATAPGGLAFQELDLSPATVAAISAIDLRTLPGRPGIPVAIHSQAPSAPLADCVARWRGQGVPLVSNGFDGLEPLLQHNLAEELAPPDFSAVLAWMRDALPPAAAIRAMPALPQAVLEPPGCIETPLRFGVRKNLFGMLCEPASAPQGLAVVIGNTGRDPHYGFGRFGVELARRLADAGIASLRIDFAGLGDSLGSPGRERMHSHMFEQDRGPDLIAAVDDLASRGYQRFCLGGMCAGAYHALHGALADPRVTTAVLINLPTFEWRPGDTVDFLNRRTAPPGPFLARLADRDTRRKLLRGELHIRRFVHAQAVRCGALLRHTGRRLRQAAGGEAPRNTAQVALAVLADRGARTLFLFSPEDSGLEAMKLEFGADLASARGATGAEIAVLPALDHQLSTAAMRRTAVDAILRFLAASS